MPTIPREPTKAFSAFATVNAIRNGATANFRNTIPSVTNADELRTFGATLEGYPALANEFVTSLLNRIAITLLRPKTYKNKLAKYKKGMIDHGEVIEEVFVELAKPHTYNSADGEDKAFKRELPDVRVVFHVRNYQKFYEGTISHSQLKSAFTSPDSLENFVTEIIQNMYIAMEYDEYLMMKYMIARHILDGRFKAISIPEDYSNKANAEDVVIALKGTSNEMEFMRTEYNPAGVRNHAEKNKQVLLIDSKYDAIMDVGVLASAFNMDKATFAGRRETIDGFGSIDEERLAILMEDEPTYVPFTAEEKEALSKIPMVLISEDWFVVYDNLMVFDDIKNPRSLYWNYFLHAWKTFGVSPFAPCAVFVPGTPAITSINLSVKAVTLPKNSPYGLVCTATATMFADRSVKWSSADSTKVAVTDEGIVTVIGGTTGDTVVVTATSVFDSTKKATCTVTIA